MTDTWKWKNPITKWSTLWEYGPGRWVEEALCAQVDPEIFFPDKGGSLAPAKLICLKCPVREECLRYALSSPTAVEGVWGGTSERQRREIRMGRASA